MGFACGFIYSYNLRVSFIFSLVLRIYLNRIIEWRRTREKAVFVVVVVAVVVVTLQYKMPLVMLVKVRFLLL